VLANQSLNQTPEDGFRSSPESLAEWQSHSAWVRTYDNSFRRCLAPRRYTSFVIYF
jgi:hypothetical protein